LASSRPNALISDPYARPLVLALGVHYYQKMADGKLDATTEGSLDPEMVADGIAIRTDFFDEFFLDATGAELRQAVILACGLDTGRTA
jgi:O-methyltransferase involved in polyketide biosynthesis